MNRKVENILSRNSIEARKVEKIPQDAGRMKDVHRVESSNGIDYGIYIYRQQDAGERDRSIKERIWAEKHIFGRIRHDTSLRAPEVIDSGERFILCSWLDGDVIGSWEQSEDNVSENEKREIAFRMGRALSEIHGINYETFGEFGREDFFRKYSSWSDFVLDLIEIMRSDYERQVIEKALDYLEQNIGLMEYNPDSVLLHGDFHVGNVLQGKKLGVVDCEAGFAGAREYEIDRCLFHWAEDWGASEQFLKGYGKENLGDNWQERKMYYRILQSVRGMVDGLNLGSSSLVDINEEELREKLENI